MPALPPVTTPPSILIVAINARYSHASLGSRYLLANMGDLRPQTHLLEFTLQQSVADIAADIAARNPRVLGLGIYIWNTRKIAELLPLLRERLPHTAIILGGPEIVAGETSPFQAHAHYLLPGDGDLSFAALCRNLLDSQPPPSGSALVTPPPDVAALALPYEEYTDTDIANRLLYVETSRGCAMRCDYCISANDPHVRLFPLPPLLAAFDCLLDRGATQFKFCDRSFNLDIPRAIQILEFFLERLPRHPGLFLHFEMLPDRFPVALRDILARFPPRTLQLEIGLQSFNPHVLETIRRPQNLEQAADNLRYLRHHTHAYLHTDLIAGLPGETPDSFADGFDRLVALDPHEIQLGILKKLPGAPIARHDDAYAMRYNPAPPYNVLSTRHWPAAHLERTARFAHYWDTIVSSNRFLAAAPLIWRDTPSVFDAFMRCSDWLGARFPREHGIPLPALVTAIFDYLTTQRNLPPAEAAQTLIRGYRHTGARDTPSALAPHLDHLPPPPPRRQLSRPLRRQALRWTWPETTA